VQSYKSGRAFRVGPGSGLRLSKYFEPNSDLHATLFHNIKSNDFFDFFLSSCRFVVLTAVTSVSEVIVTFHQLILFANTAAFFILCWDESHTVFEKATTVRKLARDGVASKRSITHAILGLV